MTYRPRPDDEAAPQRRDMSYRLQVIERWLQHAEEATATALDARYYLRWGAGGIGVLAILRFPMDARHPVTQTPYGAYAVGEVFLLTYQGQTYEGRVIERQVSRAEGL